MGEIVKPELINLGINCQILRDWIHLHIPKHEDGNNFGVEVQEEALQELQAVKEESQVQWKNMLHIIWLELISWKRFFKKEILKISKYSSMKKTRSNQEDFE